MDITHIHCITNLRIIDVLGGGGGARGLNWLRCSKLEMADQQCILHVNSRSWTNKV